ncbi:phosphohistidine phosphatase SixA [Thalassotalea sp. G2M2-11]|uniref:phosphohistidine phosphatase SixA n=1 Tax=Thalassotalea sp. G2M2-11 TaxID=2787627 RepID=UPI0019D2EEA5|nr:phosphohistidine phosphatase SixA [Thalassotalea sp. G2M2-11]
MQIFVMRHGNAVPSGPSDAQRELTELGFQEAKTMAKWLNAQNIHIDHVLVSPYQRAQQTAQTVIKDLEQAPMCQTLDFITPSGCVKTTHDYIDGMECCQYLLIVSHMPFVSYLVSELTSGMASPLFQTGAIAQLEYDEQQMRGDLLTLISPNEVG